MDLQGKIVTGDCLVLRRRELSELIIEGGVEYVWTVKDNQSSLRAEIEVAFAIEESKTNLPLMKNDLARAETIEKGHGRIEVRRIVVTSQMEGRTWSRY